MLYNDFLVELVFFETELGRKPVEEALESLSEPDIAKANGHLLLLKQQGRFLAEPYVKHLSNKLLELRFRIRPGQYRVFFFFHSENKAVLVHSIIKKTQRIPKQDMNLALSRMRQWQKMKGA